MPNKDIGFIREGQNVAIKIDSFRFTRYVIWKRIARTLARLVTGDHTKVVTIGVRRTAQLSPTHIVLILCLSALASCKSDYAVSEPDPNGEAGSDLVKVYSKEFVIPKHTYFKALDLFYTFANVQVFEHIETGRCFRSTVVDGVIRLEDPCIALWARKGGPTKAHMTFTVMEKQNRPSDSSTCLRSRIEIFVYQTYGPVQGIPAQFSAEVEPQLVILAKSMGAVPMPENRICGRARRDL